MRLLLDTHALIWWLVDNPKLGSVIIAQAMAVGLTVVTIDAMSRDYGVPVCW
jgi:PIN domain nuclease of toxin-antitoxin system